MWSKRLSLLVLAVFTVLAAAGPAPRAHGDDEVRVSVVAILATTGKNGKVEKELEAIAAEVRKKYPELTGFRRGMMYDVGIAVGQEEKFDLADGEKATVVVLHGADKNDKVRLRVKPPQLNEITYTTCCGKFFPVVTPCETKKKERLILAVMVSPCK
jgi:hypothetical protein